MIGGVKKNNIRSLKGRHEGIEKHKVNDQNTRKQTHQKNRYRNRRTSVLDRIKVQISVLVTELVSLWTYLILNNLISFLYFNRGSRVAENF